jgi:hypothetical protein
MRKMYQTQQPWAKLYSDLMELSDTDHSTIVTTPWLNEHPDEVQWLQKFQGCTTENLQTTDENLCLLYAISRVTQLMMLRFQTGRVDGDYRGPLIDRDHFQSFHETLGLTTYIPEQFHPIKVEIVNVTENATTNSKPKILETVWPGLMLGDLVFQRAGCRLDAGKQEMPRLLAERSTMFWAHRRKHRFYQDQSHGWGSNSQWRTAFRRDYIRDGYCQYNVDGKDLLERLSFDEHAADIAFDGMLEVLRHRCQISIAKTGQYDLYPYPYRWTELMTSM